MLMTFNPAINGWAIISEACRVMAKRLRDVCALPESEPLWRAGRGFVVRDHDGLVDTSWNRDKSARSYEVQTSVEPMSVTSWTPNQIAPRSGCTISGQALGTKLWVRVRAIGGDLPGDWSDPAAIIIS